jgi:hypothetical protein
MPSGLQVILFDGALDGVLCRLCLQLADFLTLGGNTKDTPTRKALTLTCTLHGRNLERQFPNSESLYMRALR